MKFKVNDSCVGCGLCAGTCPMVFHMNDEGFAESVDEEVEDELLDTALEAMDGCPVGAIEEE